MDSEKITDALGALKNPERRVILYALESEGEMAVDEVLTHLLGSQSASRFREQQTEMALKHNHLPLLEDTGFIEYDERSETVVYTPADYEEELLEVLAELESETGSPVTDDCENDEE